MLNKKSKIESICWELENLLGCYEFLVLWNRAVEEGGFDKPLIHCMDELSDFDNKRVEDFNARHLFFILSDENGEKLLKSTNCPQNLVSIEDLSKFLLDERFDTEDEAINFEIDNFWLQFEAISNFLDEIPEDALFVLWNEHQKKLNKKDFVYNRDEFCKIANIKCETPTMEKYFVYRNGEFTSSDHIANLVPYKELIADYVEL